MVKGLGREDSGSASRGRELTLVDHLFPKSPALDWSAIPMTPAPLAGVAQAFTHAELRKAASRLPPGKARGPDGVPNEVLSVLYAKFPDLLLGMYKRALSTATFPATWKVAWVVFLHKGRGKPVDSPSSFRLLCMLDTKVKTNKL